MAGKGGVVMENFTKALVKADYGFFGESMNEMVRWGVSRYFDSTNSFCVDPWICGRGFCFKCVEALWRNS